MFPEQKNLSFSLKEIFRGSLRLIRQILGACLIFEVIYRAAVALIIVSVSYVVILILQASTGQPFLNDQAILSFAFSLPGILLGLGLFLLFILIATYEQNGLIAIAAGGAQGMTPPGLSAHSLMLHLVWRALRLGLIKFVWLFFGSLPFWGVGIVLFLLQTGRNFSLASMTQALTSLWLPILILAGLYAIVVLVLVVKWTFSTYALTVERQAPVQALKRSQNLVRGNFWQVAKVRLGWFLFVATIVLGVSLLLSLLNARLIYGSGANSVFILSILVIVNIIVVVFITLITEPLNVSLITELYRKFHQEKILSQASSPKFTHWLSKTEEKKKRKPKQYRLASWTIIIGLVVGLGLIVDSTLQDVSYIASQDNMTEITAHRGYSAEAPENTLSAISKAIEVGADYAEIDVQETADGVVVIFHDDDLKRITGSEGTIGSKTYAELQELDAGVWFSEEYRGEKIPTLEEAIDIANDKIKLNIEIKDSPQAPGLAEKVAAIITSKNFVDKCVVTSFNTKALRSVKAAHQQIEVGKISLILIGNILDSEQIDLVSLDQGNLSFDFVQQAHRRGKAVYAWTVNNKDDMIRMIDIGVDNVITDEPVLFQETYQEWVENTSPQERLLRFINELSIYRSIFPGL